MEETIAEIRYWHRQRNFAMDQRKRLDLALLAFLRTQLDWSRDLPDADRKRIAEQAKMLVALGEADMRGKKADVDEPVYDEWQTVIGAALMARAPFDEIEQRAEKEMSRLAQTLPVWESFGKDIRGFGPVSLAVIVGEAGDLSNYPKKGHLWKRMGVAVLDGVRQGGLRKNASSDLWIEHGYSAVRRSRLWNIGEALKKGNGDGLYRALYLQRHHVEVDKARAEGLIVATTQAATVDSWRGRDLPAPEKITQDELKKHPERYRTAGHIAKRAQRYMEKRLLRDLWQAWREASEDLPEKAAVDLPPADYSDDVTDEQLAEIRDQTAESVAGHEIVDGPAW